MRRLSLLVSFALFTLAACKDAGSPDSAGPKVVGEPPVTTPSASGGDTPTPPPGTAEDSKDPQVPPGVVVSPKQPPPTDANMPDKPAAGATVVCTPDTRKGGVCTREFRQVCGTLADKTTKSFSNKCVACSDEKVTSYVDGPCPGTNGPA